MREIPGDRLTGQLRATRVLVPEVLGPVRTQRKPLYLQQRSQWPAVPDPEVVNYERLRPGAVVAVRTRFGVRVWLVRTFGQSRRGRRYLVGMDKKGLCHSAYLSQLISVDTLQRYAATVKAIDRRSKVYDVVT